jgi:hypothetical protein
MLAGWLCACCLLGPILAQKLDDGEAELDKVLRATKDLRSQLRKNEIIANVTDPSHQKALAVEAKEYIYPLKKHQDDALTPPEKGVETASARERRINKLNNLVEDYTGRLSSMSGVKQRERSGPMQSLFCKASIDAANEVIQKAKPIAGINAARILAAIPARPLERNAPAPEREWVAQVLPRLSDGNAELLATTCLARLEDRSIADGVRYWIMKTLISLLSFPEQKPALIKKETANKIIAASIKLAETNRVFPKATPRQEVEGYKAYRQQAVAIVALSKTPMIDEKTIPAFLLARFAGNDAGIVPAPRLDERLEAAIGLANLGAMDPVDYNGDYAAFWIANFVADFGTAANVNIGELASARQRPWRIEAARMSEALLAWKRKTKNDYVLKAITECQKVLANLELNTSSLAPELKTWCEANPPTNKTVIARQASTTVKPPGTPDE